MNPTMKATTFAGLASKIGTKTGTVKIGHNTTAERDGEAIAVRYHGHRIVTMMPGATILEDAGYRTTTTKARLNLFAPAGVSIFQKAHQWYITSHGGTFEWTGAAIVAA
jgi:hypothetical protein